MWLLGEGLDPIRGSMGHAGFLRDHVQGLGVPRIWNWGCAQHQGLRGWAWHRGCLHTVVTVTTRHEGHDPGSIRCIGVGPGNCVASSSHQPTDVVAHVFLVAPAVRHRQLCQHAAEGAFTVVHKTLLGTQPLQERRQHHPNDCGCVMLRLKRLEHGTPVGVSHGAIGVGGHQAGLGHAHADAGGPQVVNAALSLLGVTKTRPGRTGTQSPLCGSYEELVAGVATCLKPRRVIVCQGRLGQPCAFCSFGQTPCDALWVGQH